MNVLIVDDDVLLANMLKVTIAEAGIDAVVVNTFDEAIAAIDGLALDCVLTDIDLRGRTGFEIADVCRSRSIPVIMMSGHDYEYLEQLYPPLAALEAQWLAKPFEADELLQALTGQVCP